jgi:hypothetical protein
MSNKYIALDADEVARQVERLFTEYHDEVADDEALRQDLLEGETGFYEIIDKVLDHRQEALGMASMTKERATGMKLRIDRYESRAEAMTKLIMNLMEVAGVERVERPEATISRTKGRESVEITNVDDLPQGTFAIERKPDKKAIAEQLKAGNDVPGARLVTGEDGIRVNSK